jgi:putative membrane protein
MAWHIHDIGLSGWIYLSFFLVVLVVAVIFFILWSLKQQPEEESPVKVLMNRYAKGEITKEEFEEKKKDILELER